MVELVGLHRANQAEIVGTGADVRQKIGDLHAALAIADEAARAGPELGTAIDERKKRRASSIESGRGWPSYFLKLGFGSKRSSCDGPPSWKMKIQLLVCVKCGGRG